MRWWPFYPSDRTLERDLSESVLMQRFQPKTGADLIVAERQRQIEAEGWTPDHDDTHYAGELADAAACYAIGKPQYGGSPLWPWLPEEWKPTGERVRDLTKAGALIAAEIDRLRRAES